MECLSGNTVKHPVDNYFGFLNIYKTKGMTSHDVVACVRRIVHIKQVGHTGTLDPFAEGVLPVCLGKATRLIEFLDDDKEYLAVVQLGKSTTTYDLEGEITFQSEKKVTANEVSQAIKNFEGEIQQLPPIYSAIKVNGKKLYDYARHGENVEIKPRKVTIKKIELVSFDENNQSAEILVACSKGTYIRSIAYDLGQNLGTGGYLTKLTRTKAGKFTLNNSICLEDLEKQFSPSQLINPLTMLDLPRIEMNSIEIEKVSHGQFLKNRGFEDGQFVILIYNKNIIGALGAADGDKIMIKKVFL